ncbi:Hpt domain-containing protein [Dechloromonas sp.]|uniref:hybrid sensor histidine kinase/response regulator n=1 Tax=Dechloromonas sp. TaxID=1917218 RepID=UPI00122BF194|nr:Hpt domain-containing protein [Dechloromonas sp.]MBU3695712.1 response regulator [Dechloromonas sp.]TEX46305.1 MAG: hybrid sensor histidine kinase/response regulator [Rhodocyclaceae bacterium]
MNAATEFDLGPLTWVKGEIDQALQRAGDALAQHQAGGDKTPLKFCRTHLHQVHGALAIVGLDGVTQVTESMELLLAAIEDGRQSVSENTSLVIRQAIDGVSQYLDDLLAGEPNQPLRLLPVYQALALERGQAAADPCDLFHPDLSLRPPKRVAPRALSDEAMNKLLRKQRLNFQKGLLAWLKHPEAAADARKRMLDAIRAIEAAQTTQTARTFWWIAAAFLSAIDPAIADSDAAVKQLCSRFDLQIRRLLEGSGNVAERVMREALYHIAKIANPVDPAVAEVHDVFSLSAMIPGEAPAALSQPHETALRRLREVIAAAEELWNKVCTGSPASLGAFVEQSRQCAELTASVGHTDLKRLGQGLGAIANWLAEDGARYNDTVAMEVATTILLLHNAQEHFRHLGTDFAQQVDLMIARLHACIAGRSVSAEEDIPLLDEMTRRAQERLLIGQVGKEIQNNLAQIEQSLDAFFRDPAKPHDLGQLDAPLKQVAGALAMLGHFPAVDSLKACGERIQAFAAAGYVPEADDFVSVADQLSLIDFFVDALQSGESDFDAFAARMRGEVPADAEEDSEPPPALTVEAQLVQQTRETQALVDALREAPEDQQLQAELKQNLQAIQKDADLVANRELGESAKAALAALQTGGDAMAAADAALAGIRPAQAEAPSPSAATLQLAEASHDEIDAELLGIFLEEANEVLATMADQKAALAANPHDSEALTVIRRSTHTLKGSGRMVGLTELGEAAWELEQTLNLWLRQEQPVTAVLQQMIDDEHALFVDWVAHLEGRQAQAPDSTPVVNRARRLRGLQVEATPAATPEVVIVTEPVISFEPEPVPAAQQVDDATLPALELPALVETEEIPVVEPAVSEPADSGVLLDLPSLDLSLPPLDPPTSSFDVLLAIGSRDAESDNLIAFPEASEAREPAVSADPKLEETAAALADLLADDDLLRSTPESAENQAPSLAEADLEITDAVAFETPFAFDEAIDFATLDEVEAEPLTHAVSEPPPVLPPPVEPPPVTLYDIFREEARGHLQTLVESYGVLEVRPEAPTTIEMTRAAHTLGGIAATVGLMPLHHLAIALEHALLRRDGSANPASIEGLETVRQAILTLEEMFAGLARQEVPEEALQLIAALDDIYHAPLLAPEPPEELPVSAEIIPLHPQFGHADEISAADLVDETLPQPVETGEADEAADAAELPAALEAVVPAAEALVPLPPQLTDELDEQLLPIFLEEAIDQLRDLTTQLRAWREEPAGDVAPHAIARLLHTFKGNARMAGAMNLGEATHALEGRVEEAMRAGAATPALIDDVETGCDMLAQAVERLKEGPAPVVPEAEPRAEHVQAGVAPVVGDAEAESDAAGQRATLRVRADLIDRLVNEAGELSIARARIEGEMRSLKSSLLDLTENVIRLRRQLREIEIQAETQIQARVAQSPDGAAEFDPLELDRFTRFQELTRFMAESVNDVATVHQNLLKNLDDANAAILAQSRLNRGLQQELMGVRMVPFASQSERLYRIVRQTAKDVGKRANLDIFGGQLDIDRSVLDKMMAPLEHMLRNAVTHGIESRADRLAAGKPETGEIGFKLVQEGNEIILSMSDDGKGLDLARIRARAEAMGLLAAGQVAEAATLYDFIFQPGFSTAGELTQVSGRGVGMDVVKTEVTALGGRIEIVSEAGKGTTFRLYLPLTLAVTQTLLVRAGTQVYALPSTMIEQVLELKEKPLAAIRDKGEAEWQGNRYPYHFLSHLLGDGAAMPETHRQYWVLLLRSGAQRVAVQVDELKGNQEVVVKNIGAQLARVVGIAGATVLGDGQVVLILNPVALASRGVVTPVVPLADAQVVAAEPAPAATHLPTVMVVDDSLTVRKITSRLLAREGYQVVLAKDGVDALEQLIEARPDVILSDIEMPRMDGFDLVRNIRADAALTGVPIIMITSRTADKHRNYALEIGANHYLGKPYDEEELLALVAGYCGRS